MNAPGEPFVPGGWRELLRIAGPLVVSMASFTLMQFVDRVFLAHYGAAAFQAALPAGTLSFTLISFFHALAGYAGAFAAQYHGAGNPVGGARATAQGLWLTLASAPLMWALIPAGRWGMAVAGHPPEVLGEENIYFTILMVGGVIVTLNGALSGFFNGRGDTRAVMRATVVGNAVNLALDYAMIFGRWGFPRLGIAGAAWATIAGGATTALFLAWRYVGISTQAEYGPRLFGQFDAVLFRRLLRFGTPAALHLAMDSGSFAVFVLLTGRLGGVPLAASNMAFSINNIAFQPLLALNMAASILVGQYQGRRRYDIAERAGWTALKAGWLYMGFMGLTFVLFPGAYIGLFGNVGGDLPREALLRTARPLMGMMAVWGMFDAVNMVLLGALRGAGDTHFAMIYSTITAWLFWIPGEIALAVWLSRRSASGPLPDWMGGGITPLWGWLTVYVIVLSVGFWGRFRSGRWKHIRLIEPAPIPRPPRTGAEAPMMAE